MEYPETQATGVLAQETTPNEELPSPKIWDHVGKIQKDRTDERRRWVGCDITEANHNRNLGDLVYAQQNNTAKIHTAHLGRPGTSYDGSDHTRGTGPNQQLPLPSFWSLVSSEREAPTVKCRRRVGCGIHKAEFYRFNGVFILAEYNNTAEIHALLLGPPGTPDQGNASARKTAPKHWLPAPLFWYLVSSEHEGPTDEFRCRVSCCCNREAQLYRVHRASFSAEKNNTAKTNGLVIRPAGTPYEAVYSARGNTPKKQLLSAYFWYLLNVVLLIKFLLTPEIAVSQGSDFAALLALGTALRDKTRYNAVQPHETTFVAVCDAVEESLGNDGMPTIP
ncbi:hypothetical protein HPB50_027999 [Hyalomma asiaticum]|nr:hypothetical protein HPB50_027999 [Hyalomma asiaticum]